jgi:ankyrin repeat protein
VQVLLDAGAAINAADAVGDTPLHLAALEGNASLVQCC